jgi:hypothetical protein
LTAPLYFEDLAVGQTFRTGTVMVERDMIKAFAVEPNSCANPASRGLAGVEHNR